MTSTEQTSTEQTERHMTMDERVADLGIKLTVKDGPVPAVDASGWRHSAWRVTLKSRAGRSITTGFVMGEAHGTTPPTAADVLDSLLIDVGALNSCRDVNEFVREFGYDVANPAELKRARKVWAAMARMAPRTVAFLGGEAEFERITEYTYSL